MTPEALVEPTPQSAPPAAVRFHFLFAWWSLLCFLSVGIGLEILHAFKIGWYLNEDYEIRRLLWTLGHAHGTLLALVHVAFAVTVHHFPAAILGIRRMASAALVGASILLPGGFLLGGVFVYGGDPGIGVWLVPIGATFLLVGVLLVASGMGNVVGRSDPQPVTPPGRKSGKEKRRK